jgi:hypothetical protein
MPPSRAFVGAIEATQLPDPDLPAGVKAAEYLSPPNTRRNRHRVYTPV